MIEYRGFGAERLDDVIGIYERAGWMAYLGDREKLRRAFESSLWLCGAFDGDRLVGFVRCVGDGEHVVLVQDLIVDTDMKRQGVGSALLRKAMEKYAGVRAFFLVTDADDPDSNAFYRAIEMNRGEEYGAVYWR